MSSSKEIVLDLNRPLSHFHFSDSHKDSAGQLLQIRAIERIDDLIRSIEKEASATYSTQDINNCTGEYHSGHFHPIRSNNTIFVDGDRGAGKTTFLRAYLDRFRTSPPIDLKKVHPIPLIDPTLISTHQHFLVDVIASIVKEVDKKSNYCLDEIKYSDFKKSLERMAEGLKLLQGSENQKQYDAAWFLNKAISSSTSGQSLEVCFHKVIDSALTILEKDIILIAIDDVDTKTTKANEVLETIRCYLTHPRLVIMLSGDFALYSHIVRKNKEDELGETAAESKKDKVGVEKRGRLVETLQLQYLSKVLPIEQRVQLAKLDSLAKEYDIKIKHDRLAGFQELVDHLDGDLIDLKLLLKAVFSQSLYINERHQDSHLSFILSQPVRTVLQTLKSMIEWEILGTYDSQKFYGAAFKQTLYNNYLGALSSEGISFENLLLSPHVNSIGYELFIALCKHNELETGFYARPDSTNDQLGYNVTKLYLSATMSSYMANASESTSCHSFSSAIKLMLTCGASASIFSTYVENNLTDRASFSDYLSYIGLDRHERISSVAAHYSMIALDGYENGSKQNVPKQNVPKQNVPKAAVASGVIRTPRRKPAGFKDDIFETCLINSVQKKRLVSLDKLEKEYGTWPLPDQMAAKAVLLGAHHAVTITEGRSYISIYSFLAGLAELCDFSSSTRQLDELIFMPTYTYPTFLNGKSSGSEDGDPDDTFDEKMPHNTGNDAERISTLVSSWTQKQPKLLYSSILLGKVWVRLFYMLNSVSDSLKESMNYGTKEELNKADALLGLAFTRFSWAIINSVLIEEYRYKNDRDSYDLLAKAKNVNRSARELVSNLREVKERFGVSFEKELPLTFYLLSCPLLWPFLGKQSMKDSDGEQLCEIVREIICSPSDAIGEDFDAVTRKDNELINGAELAISALPIMGCFRDKLEVL